MDVEAGPNGLRVSGGDGSGCQSCGFQAKSCWSRRFRFSIRVAWSFCRGTGSFRTTVYVYSIKVRCARGKIVHKKRFEASQVFGPNTVDNRFVAVVVLNRERE